MRSKDNHQVELDFLGLHHSHDTFAATPPPPPTPSLNRRRSFCGISKINPEIVKSVIASSVPAASSIIPNHHAYHSPPSPPPHLPIFHPHHQIHLPNTPGASTNGSAPDMAPLTIFYKGTVSVFDLPQKKAEDLIKFVSDEKGKANTQTGEDKNDVASSSFSARNADILGLGTLGQDGDMPIKRKKSLQRFFEKRKERLISASPYPIHDMVRQEDYRKASV